MDLIIAMIIAVVGFAALAFCMYSIVDGMNKKPMDSFHHLPIPEREEMKQRLLFKMRCAAHGATLVSIILAVAALHLTVQYLSNSPSVMDLISH